MSPSRAAFLSEFERLLPSPGLREWLDTIRRQHPCLSSVGDPVALRQFLHTRDKDPRKPEIWRALVIGLQANQTPNAVTYVLGLLEPGLGALVDRLAGQAVDPDDLWQEAVSRALEALANPRVRQRNAVLSGLLKDTFSKLRLLFGAELARSKYEVPLEDTPPEPDWDEVVDPLDEEALLADWCRSAGITPEDTALILDTRLNGVRLPSVLLRDERVA
jgi:DNA-directed RNA polymerase specialized sigma24 family protein